MESRALSFTALFLVCFTQGIVKAVTDHCIGDVACGVINQNKSKRFAQLADVDVISLYFGVFNFI